MIGDPKWEFAHLIQFDDTMWCLMIHFEGDFAENFEIEQFPLDIQFLNINFLIERQYRLLRTPPEWLTAIQEFRDNGFDSLIDCSLGVQPNREWRMLSTWIDYRRNHNNGYYPETNRVIRLRVERVCSLKY